MPPKPKQKLEQLSFSVTGWIGSIQSLVVHTIFFVGSFVAVVANIVPFDRMLLVLTTVVSLEAIYLSIFIQMSLNHTRVSLAEVEEDIDEIQEDVGEIQEDVGEIQEDVDELQGDLLEELEGDTKAS